MRLTLMTYRFRTQGTGVHQADFFFFFNKSIAFLSTCRKAKTCISDICKRTIDYVSKYFVHLL